MKYINYKSFDIEDKSTELNFEVDEMMAETISILNKKGYYTNASCAGHLEYDPIKFNLPAKEFKEFEKEASKSKYKILKQNDNEFLIEADVLGKNIYISFLNAKNITLIPKNPKYTKTDKVMKYLLYLVDENDNYREKDDVLNEIKEVNLTLLNWAKDLPDLLEDKKKKQK